MSSRQRPRPSAATARAPTQTQRITPLPAYETPTAPLNRRAINALENIPRSHDLSKLQEEQKALISALTTSTDEINDRAYQAKRKFGERKDKIRERGGDEDVIAEQEAATRELSDRVDALTARLEEKIRSAIDAQERVAALEKALETVNGDVIRGDGRVEVAATQSTLGASQFRSRRATTQNDGEAEGTGGGVGIVTLLKRKVDIHNSYWKALPMRDRYGSNNDYVGFRKVLHDAQNQGDNAPPVPHANTWFPNERSTSDPTGTQPDEDVDSDIEIASERISTKCPITLVELKDAITTPCGHNFEASAIKEMLSRSTTRIGGTQRGRATQAGELVIQCPETSCNKMVTDSSLRRDPHVRRRILRLQTAKQQSQDADLFEDEDDTRSPRKKVSLQEITSSVANTPAHSRRSVAANIKRERASGLPSGTQGTTIVDLEDEDDESQERRGGGRRMIVDLEDDDDDEEEEEEYSD